MNYKKIHSVVSGESAIEYSKIEKPDLILMDIELGGKLNGLETASLIKTFCDAKIIFITSYPDNEFLNKLQSFNSSKYLIKPVSIDNIVNIIGRL